MKCVLTALLLFLFTGLCCTDASGYHGVIAVSTSNGSVAAKYCTTFNPKWLNIAKYDSDVKTAPKYPLQLVSQVFDGCGVAPNYLNGTAVIVIDRGDCSVEERAANLLKVGTKMIVIARTDGILNVTNVNQTKFSEAPIVLINSNSYHSMADFAIGNEVYLSFYYPITHFDGNVIVIYAICILCIAAGSYWSLYPKNMKISEFWTTSPKPPLRLDIYSNENTEDASENDSKGNLMMNFFIGTVMVGLMAGMLLLLYFAYKYFVFVFIALFCVISTTGMYQIVSLFLAEIKLYHIKWQISIFGYETFLAPFKVMIWIACFSIAIFWFFFRHLYDIWPLQALMGICICLHIIKSVALPNFKIITIIMVMLFVYDIFFVFITPYFTKDGISIMERVATGSSGKPVFDSPQDYTPTEQIPLSIKIPYFQKTDVKVCSPIYGMIGFGDIVVPGLLVAYSAYFDTLAHPGKFKWYYLVSVISYAVGLVFTYIALNEMEVPQPALLYLVPCCLLGVFGTAIKRRDLKALWTGVAGFAEHQQFSNE